MAVYVTVAACSAASEHVAGKGSAAGEDGGLLAEAAALIDAALDQIVGPVQDAKAAPQVNTVQCGTGLQSTSGAFIYEWAEQQYPGKTSTELAHVAAILRSQTQVGTYPPGYTDYATTVWVRDGAAAVNCGAHLPDAGAPQASVTFVLP